MHDWLRARLILALALPCALGTVVSCKKADDEATSDDESNTKKKKKTKTPPDKKKEGAFVPTDYQGFSCGSCSCSYFCTDEPEIVDKMKDTDDGGNAIIRECGKSAKVPASVAKPGHENTTAGIMVQGTKNVRPEHPNACCYSYRTGPCGKGRPLRDGDRLVVADDVSGSPWSSPMRDLDATIRAAAEALANEPAEARAAFVTHLRYIGALEHASIAAFARASLDLLALGAPPDLIAAAHDAALDEVRHARIAYALASALDGDTTGPGPLTLPAFDTTVDPEKMFFATLVEGCVGEGLGALSLHAAALGCTIEPLAALYATIADDEARHAELAFKTVRFLLERIEPAERDTLVAKTRATLARLPFEPGNTPHLPSLGLLGRDAQREVFRDGMRDAIDPAVTMLISVAA